jgi:two-component system sensor histidine kinase/response regulator
VSLVLIADDEEPTLEILAEVMAGLGHQVLKAHDGEEALTLARTHHPDLILTDFMMPRRTGIELIRTLRSESTLAETPVILMSAASPRAANEADVFLAKPLKVNELEHEVKNLLVAETQHQRSISPPPVHASLEGTRRPEALNWVAHELKSPLSAVRMSAELLRRRLEVIGDDHDRNRVAVVLRGLDRMTSLINSVLDAAALGEGRLALRRESLDVVAFVERVVALWRDLHPEFELVVQAPNDRIEATLDEQRIQQVLENLLSNAIKYSGEHKRVDIQVALQAGLVVISIRDRGRGIAAADLPRLFERFHRAEDARGEGHGLGLFIASALAKLHGGAISVKSELGRGTTFSLSVPRVS